MLGSIVIQAKVDAGISIYAQTRNDDTSRYKMLFTKLRHAAEMKPHELVRYGGGNAFSWEALEWCDADASPRTDSIMDALRHIQSGTTKEICHKTGVPERTFYREIKSLIKEKLVRKEGNLYILQNAVYGDSENGFQ